MSGQEDHGVERERAELERLLVRSARLDMPNGALRERVAARGLSALAARPRHLLVKLGGAALALAAAVALAVSLGRSPAAPAHVAAERVHSTAPPPSASSSMPRAACPELVVARGDAPMIEDFETDDSWLLSADGRKGSWITYDDGTGKQVTPSHSALFPSRIPGARAASKRGLHARGGKFTAWGVTLGVELADAACYDASAYAGIELWARGRGELRVGLQMIDVQGVKYGGLCQRDCYDTHRKTVELGPSFQKFVIRWDELVQLEHKGAAVDFDPKRVRFLEFGIPPESTPFDVWLDDIAFVRR